MKKILFALIILIFSLPVYAAERTDNADSISNVYQKSNNIVIFSNNAGNFGGDAGRIGRINSEIAFVTYELQGCKEVQFTVYSDNVVDESVIQIYLSSDNTDFKETRMYRSYSDNNGNIGYSGYNLVVKDIPEEMKYIKLQWQKTSKYKYIPQISEVRFSDSTDAYDSDGLLFTDEFDGSGLMYDKGANFRFEGGNDEAMLNDTSRMLRVYDIESAVKYKIKNPINLSLAYFVMDGAGTVDIYASSHDGEYKLVESEKTFPVHTARNWSVVYLTANSFPDDTEFIKLVCPVNGHTMYAPILSKLEVRY